MCAVKQFCQAMATDLVFVLDELNFDNTSDVYSLKKEDIPGVAQQAMLVNF